MLIVKSIFGSRLYGTHTESSDTDFKGIYLPSLQDLIHLKYKDTLDYSTNKTSSKNSKEDVDFQVFSLQYFGRLCERGDMIGFDMLHTPSSCIVEYGSPELKYIWDYIVMHRSKFYSKNLVGYIGYIARQVNKYGAKGSRVKTLEDTIAVIEKTLAESPKGVRFSEVWSEIQKVEGVSTDIRTITKNKNEVSTEFLSIVGKCFDRDTPLYVVAECLIKEYKEVGQRAIAAKENLNVDWKAVSHAMRVCFQIEELLRDETITFPLPKADYIKKIKNGEYSFAEVSETLEQKKEEVLGALAKKDWKERPDMTFWNDLIDYAYNTQGKNL